MKKFKILILTICLSFVFPFFSHASTCYLGTGATEYTAGSTNANGTYVDTGTTNDGEPVYINENGMYLFWWSSYSVYIVNTSITSASGLYSRSTPITGNYSPYDFNIAEITCGDGGGGSGSTTSSTLISFTSVLNGSTTEYSISTSTLEVINNLVNLTVLIFSIIILLILVVIALIIFNG